MWHISFPLDLKQTAQRTRAQLHDEALGDALPPLHGRGDEEDDDNDGGGDNDDGRGA